MIRNATGDIPSYSALFSTDDDDPSSAKINSQMSDQPLETSLN